MKMTRFTLFVFILFLSNFAHETCFSNPSQGFLVTTLPRPNRLEIRLISQEPYEITHKTSENKLWLSFNNSIQADRIKGLMKEAPKWFQIIRQEGPKSLYFEAKTNNSFIVEKLDRSIIITILKDKNPTNKTTPEVLIDKTPNRAELTLLWPKDLLPKIEHDRDQLIFNFAQPINNPQLNELWKILPQWITSSTAYYDSFVIRLAQDIKAHVTNKGPQTIIDFSYSQLAEKEQYVRRLTPSSPDIRLDRLTGQAQLRADRDFEARSKFSTVIEDTPTNLEAMRWRGDTEGHLKRWRKAIMVYDNMFSLDPQEYGVAFNKAFQYHEYGSYIRFEPEWWHVEGQETQYIGRLSGRQTIGPNAQFEGAYEERYIKNGSIFNRKGQSLTFEGDRRQGFGTLIYNFDSMDKAQIGMYGQNGAIGAGAAYTIGWKLANTRVGVNYHATDWNFLNQIVQGGTIDNVNLKHDQLFGERLSWDTAISYNRFNLRYKENVATSIRFNNALNYVVINKDPTLTLGYAIIAEYKEKIKKATAINGTPYVYLPIVTSEAHIFTARTGALLFDYFAGEAVGGYGFDRFGTHGPVMGLAFYYEPVSTFQIGINAKREKLFSRGSTGGFGSSPASGTSNTKGSTPYVNTIGLSATVRF